MTRIEVNTQQAKLLERAINLTGKNLRRELAMAINATSTKTKRVVNSEIRKELAVSKKAVDVAIRGTGRATADRLSTSVMLRKTKRIPLKEFKPNQKKEGVSYRISKSSGRRTMRGAFMGPKPKVRKVSWKNNVFKRKGKSRLPIVKKFGPSPWAVFLKQDSIKPTEAETQAELQTQVMRRVRENVLRATGVIKSKR